MFFFFFLFVCLFIFPLLIDCLVYLISKIFNDIHFYFQIANDETGECWKYSLRVSFLLIKEILMCSIKSVEL